MITPFDVLAARINFDPTEIADIEWVDETQEFNYHRMKDILNGIEDMEVMEEVAELINDEWEELLALKDNRCYYTDEWGMMKCLYFNGNLSSVLEELKGDIKRVRGLRSKREARKQQIRMKYKYSNAIPLLGPGGFTVPTEAVEPPPAVEPPAEKMPWELAGEALKARQERDDLQRQVEEARRERDDLQRQLEEARQQLEEAQQDEEEDDGEQLTNRQLMIMMDLFLNVGFRATDVNQSALAALLSAINGRSARSIRTTIGRFVDYDSPSVAQDVERVVQLLQPVSEEWARKLENNIQ